MSVDSDLVDSIKAALATDNVYHMEVFQQASVDNSFPCVVYIRISDAPIEELDANSGWWKATYAVYILAYDGEVMRSWADTLVGTLTGPYGNGWIQWSEDAEVYSTPMELQELGIKQTQVSATVTRDFK
jgi:hypothetical protein